MNGPRLHRAAAEVPTLGDTGELGALLPPGPAHGACVRQSLPWCCPHLAHSLSCLCLLGRLLGFTAYSHSSLTCATSHEPFIRTFPPVGAWRCSEIFLHLPGFGCTTTWNLAQQEKRAPGKGVPEPLFSSSITPTVLKQALVTPMELRLPPLCLHPVPGLDIAPQTRAVTVPIGSNWLIPSFRGPDLSQHQNLVRRRWKGPHEPLPARLQDGSLGTSAAAGLPPEPPQSRPQAPSRPRCLPGTPLGTHSSP